MNTHSVFPGFGEAKRTTFSNPAIIEDGLYITSREGGAEDNIGQLTRRRLDVHSA